MSARNFGSNLSVHIKLARYALVSCDSSHICSTSITLNWEYWHGFLSCNFNHVVSTCFYFSSTNFFRLKFCRLLGFKHISSDVQQYPVHLPDHVNCTRGCTNIGYLLMSLFYIAEKNKAIF